MKFEFFRVLEGVQSGAWPFLYFFIAMISLVVALLIATIIITRQREIKYEEELKRKFNTNRTFIIDFKNQSVEYFSFRDLKEVIKVTYDDFLGMFVEKERTKLSNWLMEIAHTNGIINSENSTFITDMIVKDTYKSYCSRILFNVKVIDKQKGMMFLDSVLLHNLPSEYNKIKKGIFKKDVFQVSEIARFYAHGLFQKGSMFVISFHKKPNSTARINEYEFRYLILNGLYKRKNALTNYVLFNEENPLVLTILNSKPENEYQVSREIKVMIKVIKEIIEVHGFKSIYDFNIVGCKTTELDNDFMKAYDTILNVAKLTHDSGKESYLFKNENNENRNIEESYKGEVNKIVKMQSISLSFSPLIKIANKRILTQGYIATVKPKGSIFSNIDDAKKYALKYNLDKELFSMISRKMIPTFNNEKENNSLKLFFSIKLNEIQYVLRSLPHMNLATNTKIALIIDNNEFVDKETDVNLINNIKSLQSRDYEVYVKLKTGDYNLRSATYSLFDGFLIDTKTPSATKAESREFLVARAMLDKLVKYKAPIVSINTQNWSEIEILVKSGINLFSSEVISPSMPMLVPVDKKSSKKLLNMYKK